MKASESTRLYFEHAADRVDLDERMRNLLLAPKREVQVQVAIEMDDGEIEISNLGWDAEGRRFLERSRHRFPRRDRDSYALEAY